MMDGQKNITLLKDW